MLLIQLSFRSQRDEKIMLWRIPIAVAIFFIIYSSALGAIGLSYKSELSDIAVVLGNEVLKDGTPSRALQSRLDAALVAYRAHMARSFMVSGGVGKSGYNEAKVMAKYLREHGIPENEIIVDTLGINTRATALNTAKIMRERDLKSVLIVSQFYHLPRCVLAFHQAGITNLSATYYPVYFLLDIPSLMREGVALPVYYVGGK